MSKKVVLKIDDLSYAYREGAYALEHVNIEIYENDFVAIIGQNGAGKSTLLKNITGLLRPTEGAIYVNGKDNKEMSIADISKEIGFVLQNPDRQLFADTVYQEIEYGPKNLGLPEEEIKERVEDAIKMAGLEGKEEDYPPALSAGERAKVVIASVAAMRPDVIILDEPTTGQDNRGRTQIMEIAKKFHELGHTIIVVTHDMSLVAKYAKRTLVFCKGQLLLQGTTREVFAQEEKIKEAYILPPQVTRMAAHADIGTEDTILTVEEMVEFLKKKKLNRQ